MMSGVHLMRVLRKWKRRSTGYEQIAPVDSFQRRYRRSRNAATVVVGKEKRVFKVDPQILEYELFQPLLERSRIRRIDWNDKENGYKASAEYIFLDCDAILFEHMLWLVHNDDPCLRYLNLEMLMEFYAQEDCTLHL